MDVRIKKWLIGLGVALGTTILTALLELLKVIDLLPGV